MYCRECGNQVNDKAEICTSCGVRPLNGSNYCQSCGAETKQEQELCIQCGVKLKKFKGVTVTDEDKSSGLLNGIVCCFPLVGIILYFVWKNEKPNSAKAVCKWAIAGTVLGVIFYIVAFILGFMSEMMYYY